MGFGTHLDDSGHPMMVDVGSKDLTSRRAVACGWIILPDKIYNMVDKGDVPKGDVLKVAELAGIMAAKKTCEIIPLCHNIRLDHVKVRCELDELRHGIKVTSEVSAREGIDKGMHFEAIRLVEKSGGKSGNYLWEDRESAQDD